jgi:hypothetical protein
MTASPLCALISAHCGGDSNSRLKLSAERPRIWLVTLSKMIASVRERTFTSLAINSSSSASLPMIRSALTSRSLAMASASVRIFCWCSSR